MAGWLVGWLAGCQQCIWDTQMRQKRVHLARKCVKNAYPQGESQLLGHQNASKTRTLSTKVRQKRVPLSRKSFPKRGCLVGYGRNPKMILSQCCMDFDTKTYRFGHISGPSYRGAHAGWPAGWLVGWLVGWLAGSPKCVKNVYP